MNQKLIFAAAGVAFATGVLALGSALAQDKAVGKAKANACATCHGVDGISTLPIAPHLAGQPAQYLIDQLKAYRDGKRVSDMMNLLAKPLSDKEIADLAAWYASIEIKANVPN